MYDISRTSFIIPLTVDQFDFPVQLHLALNQIQKDEEIAKLVFEGQNGSNQWIDFASKLESEFGCFNGAGLLDSIRNMVVGSGIQIDDFFSTPLFQVESLQKGLKVFGTDISDDFVAAYTYEVVSLYHLSPVTFCISYWANDYLADSFEANAFCVTSEEIKYLSVREWMDDSAS